MLFAFRDTLRKAGIKLQDGKEAKASGVSFGFTNGNESGCLYEDDNFVIKVEPIDNGPQVLTITRRKDKSSIQYNFMTNQARGADLRQLVNIAREVVSRRSPSREAAQMALASEMRNASVRITRPVLQ